MTICEISQHVLVSRLSSNAQRSTRILWSSILRSDDSREQSGVTGWQTREI